MDKLLEVENRILDQKLVKAIRKGDHFAFDGLFNKYSMPLYSFILSILKNKHDAEEAVQDVFYKIWEKRKELDPELSFKAYLFKIALNAAKKHYRKKLQDEKYKQEIALGLNVDPTTDLSDVEYKNLLDYVDKLINLLPPSRREIFIMSKKDGMKNLEIAEKLNISEQTVKNQLVSAQKFLKAQASKSDSELNFLFFRFFMELY